MDRTKRAFSLAVATLLGAAAAGAESPGPPSIWYRSGEGCPDGAGFLQRLQARGIQARLAAVGDPIDFVVTLGNGSEGPRGLLERQTKTGTVAIRRLDGGTCEEIADGLALSLSLADAPEERRRAEPATAPAREPEAPPRSAPSTSTPEPSPESQAAHASESRLRLEVGIQASVVTGVAPDPTPGIAGFLEFAPRGRGILSRASFRAAGFAHTAAPSSDGRDYRVWLGGARIEGCPTWIGSSLLRVSPCLAVDLGTLQTVGSGSNARTEGAFWAAGRFGARLDFRVAESFGFEVQVDGLLPFTRYDIVAGQPERTLFRTAAVGLSGALGAYFVLP